MRTVFVALFIAVLFAIAIPGAATSVTMERAPIAVSPGEKAEVVPIASFCPTFSWGPVAGAATYELVVVDVEATADERTGLTDAPRLRVQIPGGGLAWSPSLDRCLTPGIDYAWAVRGLGPSGAAGEAGPWSEPRLFRIDARAAQRRLDELIERAGESMIRPHREAVRSEQPLPPSRIPETLTSRVASGRDGSSIRSKAAPNSTPTARALSASLPDTSGTVTIGVEGETFSEEEFSRGVVGRAHATTGTVSGVFGLSVSPAGKGVFGRNEFVSDTGGAFPFGVFGQIVSEEGGAGTFGVSEGTAGFGRGVLGVAKSDAGIGVAGSNEAAGFGTSGLSTGGIGVFGESETTSGFTSAVWGQISNPDGYAGYFRNEGGPGSGGLLAADTAGGDGIAEFRVTDAGGVEARGDLAALTQGTGLILRATDGAKCFRLTVDNSGTLSTAEVACP